MSETWIQLEKAAVGYGNTAVLRDLSFTLGESEFVTIVGPNGSGKTALVRTLLGLQPLLEGTLSIFGQNQNQSSKTQTPSLKGLVGYVPQHAQLNLGVPITGREFLDLKSTDALAANESLLAEFGVKLDTLEKPLQNLSAGQRQKILVTFALLGKPKLICLDEATDGLDFKSQKEFFDNLKKYQKLHGTSVILVSHDISAVGSYANRVLCLNQTLMYDGDPNSSEFHSCLHGIYGKDSFIHDHGHHGHKH